MPIREHDFLYRLLFGDLEWYDMTPEQEESWNKIKERSYNYDTSRDSIYCLGCDLPCNGSDFCCTCSWKPNRQPKKPYVDRHWAFTKKRKKVINLKLADCCGSCTHSLRYSIDNYSDAYLCALGHPEVDGGDTLEYIGDLAFPIAYVAEGNICSHFKRRNK